MADTTELIDVLVGQVWEVVRVFMNQRPDDVTDEQVRLSAEKVGIPLEEARFAMKMIDVAPLPPWGDLSLKAQQAWWHGVVYQLMPTLASWSGDVYNIHMEGRN